MKKLLAVSSVFVLSIFNSSAQIDNSYAAVKVEQKDEIFDQRLQTENSEMLMLPSFVQLPSENQVIVISQQEEKIIRKYKIESRSKDSVNIKVAALYLEKGGNQLVAGATVPLVSTAFGVLLILASVGGSTSSTGGSNSGIALLGTAVILGGSIAGVVLNISGASNLAKAGRALKGETIY